MTSTPVVDGGRGCCRWRPSWPHHGFSKFFAPPLWRAWDSPHRGPFALCVCPSSFTPWHLFFLECVRQKYRVASRKAEHVEKSSTSTKLLLCLSVSLCLSLFCPLPVTPTVHHPPSTSRWCAPWPAHWPAGWLAGWLASSLGRCIAGCSVSFPCSHRGLRFHIPASLFLAGPWASGQRRCSA